MEHSFIKEHYFRNLWETYLFLKLLTVEKIKISHLNHLFLFRIFALVIPAQLWSKTYKLYSKICISVGCCILVVYHSGGKWKKLQRKNGGHGFRQLSRTSIVLSLNESQKAGLYTDILIKYKPAGYFNVFNGVLVEVL